MLFFTLSNTNIKFAWKKLTERFYTIVKTLQTTKLVEIIDKKKFAKWAFNEHVEAFVVYITSFSLNLVAIHLTKETQIVLLIAKKIADSKQIFKFFRCFFRRKSFDLFKSNQVELIRYQAAKRSATTL